MKKVEQVNKSGNIVIDYDQILTTNQIRDLMFELFNPIIKQDEKQFVLYDKIAILACNVTYLGNPHPLYKKRIQLKQYYLDYLAKNAVNNLKTLYVGIYSYNKTRLFVVFEPTTYASKKSNNSAAHVYSINLQYAQRVGRFSKIDHFGNNVQIFNTYEFVRYIKTLAGDQLGGADSYDSVIKIINEKLSSFTDYVPSVWYGVDCYKEMINARDPNARQGEWQGWYFEYLFKKYIEQNRITEISWHADRRDGGIDLDLKFNRDWTYGDLKADQIEHDILGNSFETLDTVIKDNDGTVYYICCLYRAEKDSEHGYKVTRFWNSLRDEPYTDENDIRNRYGKRMKFAVEPKRFCVIKLDSITYNILKKNPFAQGLNSDGNERKPKLKVSKDMITALSVYSKDF